MGEKDETTDLNGIWYGVAFLLISISIFFFAQSFSYMAGKSGIDKTYVGGDAYNYIIAGTYSTTIMLRAVFFAMLAGFSLLMSKK